jgi:pimeloyl-ACP methyl ester carboxylesterase
MSTTPAVGGATRAALPALALALFLALTLVPLGASAPKAFPLVKCALPGNVDARCGTFRVPVDRARPDGRTISLRVAVVPARDGGTKADPVVYITGGPGGSATADAAGMLSIFSAANASRDIVLVDQRGTGGSNRLECPVPRTAPKTAPAVRAYVKACLARFEADPSDYTTVPAMDDLAAVLRALGYRSVNLYGISYGATAAQYFLHRHPALVRTAILDGATLLDVPVFERWGGNGDRALRQVLARCAASRPCAKAFPRVRREAFEVIAALRRKPVRAEGMLIDAATAAGALQALSRSPDGAAQIPWVAHRARVRDWIPLMLAIDERGGGGISTRLVMFWSIVCNERWARWSPERSAADSRGTYLAERTALDARLVAAACSAVPKHDQPPWTMARIRSDKPVLFVVGGSDPQDPVSHVRGATRELPSSRTLVVPSAGHGSVQVGCVPRIAQLFIERGSGAGLDTSCVARYRPPPFVVR